MNMKIKWNREDEIPSFVSGGMGIDGHAAHARETVDKKISRWHLPMV
jgi:hypothetical protein